MTAKRFITIPNPTPFIDPNTRESVKMEKDGETVDVPSKSHWWYVHTYVRSHLIFAVKIGGYDAVRASKDIEKALNYAEDNGLSYYEVTEDQLLMMRRTFATPSGADLEKGEKLSQKAASKSSLGMSVQMSNFEAQTFFPHMDAIMNASTNRPEEAMALTSGEEEAA